MLEYFEGGLEARAKFECCYCRVAGMLYHWIGLPMIVLVYEGRTSCLRSLLMVVVYSSSSSSPTPRIL